MPEETVPIAPQVSKPHVISTPAEQIVAIPPPSAKQAPSRQKWRQFIKQKQKASEKTISTIQETERQNPDGPETSMQFGSYSQTRYISSILRLH